MIKKTIDRATKGLWEWFDKVEGRPKNDTLKHVKKELKKNGYKLNIEI